ncbi:ras guanine nucleotide exchange factor domain-containing protein [Halteromyces radiatus]|uniref:ras guanine nucleotide exchange factor domain-containing protein n=1 Tax=Halteromyces radiatus TaxID=101107 RepID=UPI00221F353B|nr:ras guanine nucleotide exchange factor domain-containing protein [Halteromyces radiatus]KAI8089221.1 ras guanine nucleotide exchange factor domain-containing protein [Halteromyces radiatus]
MVTDSIRLMLLASGTIDKDSNYIRSNTVLRGHHRTMMAAMSKVMLTSFLTADHGSEYVPKLLNENNELLVAVRNFVGTCQDIGVPVQHIDPKLVLDGDSTGYKQASQKKSEQQAKYALQHDLADNLDVYGTNMHESVDAILFNIKAGRQQEDDHFTDNYRFLFGTKMFTQFRNLSSQTGQFLGLVDDIDFVTVEGSPLISDLQQNKQALSDGLGRLFCHLQQVTNQHVPLDNVLLDVEMAAKSIHIPIRNICECINILVYDNDITTRPSLDTIATDTIKHTTISSTTNAYSDGDDGLIDDRSSSDSRANATSKPKITTAIMEKTPNAPVTNDPSTASQELEVTKSSHKLKKFFGDDVPSSDIVTTNPTTADRPSYLSYDYDLSDISFNMEGNVKGGTLAALVERLTLHDYLDMNFNNTFLLTYRSFCTSTELLDLLEARYNLVPPSDISDDDMEIWRQKKLKLVRLRVFNVLKNWLEVYYDEEDQIILDRLMKFTDTTIRMTLSFSTDQLERLIQKRKEGTEMDVGGLKKLVWTPQSIPQSILPRNPKKFKLLDLDPTELARQLTIMDFKMYSSIRPIECLDKSWSRETPDDAAPTSVNIRASIEYCNQVTSWVSDAILSQNDIKKRCNLIKFWVQVAEKCRELNNFNTCMAILSAFDNSSVGRLKRTWEMVGARTNQILSQIRKIMGANRNFSEYRQLIHSVNPPCIPFLGIYLQDLTFIEDGNSNIIKKSKDLINFAKREKTAEVIREIQQYQTLFYKLKTVDEVQSFIRANLQSTRDEDQLYKESLKLEPREREDEKITRLLQESGFL